MNDQFTATCGIAQYEDPDGGYPRGGVFWTSKSNCPTNAYPKTKKIKMTGTCDVNTGGTCWNGAYPSENGVLLDSSGALAPISYEKCSLDTFCEKNGRTC